MMEIVCKQNQISLNLLEHFVTDFNREKKPFDFECISNVCVIVCVLSLRSPHTLSAASIKTNKSTQSKHDENKQ